MGISTPSTGKRTIFFIILSYLAFSFFNYSYITEDAFIFFRVAEYLHNGYGCVFNPGDRTEVCSSLSWLFLLTLFRTLGANILTTSKIAGIILGCFSLFIIYKLTRHFTAKAPWVTLPSLLTSLALPFLMWNQMGLETPLYTLVFLSLVIVCLDSRSFRYWPLISIMLVLTRPEGLFLLLGIIPAFYCYREKHLLKSIALFTLLYLTILAIRFYYFHDFLPSPFYAKMYAGKYAVGLDYLHQYFKDYYLYYFCSFLLCIIGRKWNWQEKRSILFGFIIVYLLWIILGGAETKPFYRHIVPLIPLIYIYIITGLANAFGDIAAKMKLILCSSIIAFGCASLLLPVNYSLLEVVENPVTRNIKSFIDNPSEHLRFCSNRIRNPAAYNYIDQNLQLFIGEFVRHNYFSGTKLLYDQMGQTPYQAGIDYYFIDSWGLTDNKIGKYYFHEKIKDSPLLQIYETVSSSLIKRFFPETEFINSHQNMVDYIFQQKPDVIMIVDQLTGFKNFLPHWLIQDWRFRAQYRLSYKVISTLIYEKRGLSKKPLYVPEGFSVTRR